MLNTTIINYKKNNFENIEENYQSLNNERDMKSNVEMPPQRDIRDSQPTISVNYRVIKNAGGNNLKNDQDFSGNANSNNDWDNEENDW
ncbi:hypothetical protein [uncultured Prochlorococcus sp.]|uniref:hypothetical protein n=1 Tax=uncultured Prochlorococcus sp. TaxID=159733 RepID=UPI00258F47C6|nr:hypothetical protein [uncultured Prochlorococcus sp.]